MALLVRWAATLMAALGVSLAAVPAGANAPDLASYRAVYDLSIDTSDEQSGDTTVSGRLVVEFAGSRCAGYKSKMRFVTESEDADGQTQITDARTETTETASGRFEFLNQTYVNEELAEESQGVATRGADGTTVVLKKPAEKTFTIEGAAVFPTEQLKKIIAAAQAGEHFVPMEVFDGSQTGDVVFASATVIGKVSTATDDYGDESLVSDAGFAGLKHWPLTVSYFEKHSGTDDTPSYITSFVAYSNGIGRKLKIDYGKFALTGTITHLDMLTPPPC